MDTENAVCEICGIVIELCSYSKHLKSHNTKLENHCHLCQKKFSSKYNLQYHLAHHLNERTFLCNECPKAYNTIADLAQHKWTHLILNEPSTCSTCGLCFTARNKYNAHMKTHEDISGKKKLTPKGAKECSDCPGKMFLNLHEHRKVVHLGQRNFVCILCDKSFGKKSGLDRHKLTVHEKSREFKCEAEGCKKAFGERSLLQRHLRTHTEQYQQAKISKIQSYKPKNLLFCAFCNKTIDDMKTHYEKVHPDLKNSCKFCHKRFKSFKIMERHVKVFHEVEKNFFCDLDLKGFAEKYQLRRHMQTHCKKLEKMETSKTMNVVKREQENGCEINQTWSTNDLKSETTDNLIEEVKIKESNRDLLQLEEILVKSETLSDDESTQNSSFEMKSEPNESIVIFTEELSSSMKQSQSDFKNSIVKKMLKCKQCNELFDDLDCFNRHFSSTHKTKYEQPNSTTCKFCHKTFAKFQFLKLHVAAIHEKNLFECEICGKKFSFERAKTRHVEVVHKNQRNYECSHCQKLFGTSTQMKEHVKYYHSSEPLEQTHYCKSCDKYFAQAKNLRQHYQSVHLGIKQKAPTEFKCKLCKEIFTNKYQKEKHHAQVHFYGKKLKRSCRICEKEFELFEDFKMHIDSHQLPFVCLICGTNSLDKDSFDVHRANHRQVDLNLRKHICDICGHRFFKRLQVMIHMRKHMENANAYVCDICGAGYKYIAPFLYHKKAHEGKKDFICTFCGKGFISKQDLTVHIRSHTQEKPFKCTICNRAFTSKAILSQHYQTHPETRRILTCSACNLTFEDKKQAKSHDLVEHPDRVPFKCNVCGEAFKLAHSLRSHSRHKHKVKDGLEHPPTDEKRGILYFK